MRGATVLAALAIAWRRLSAHDAEAARTVKASAKFTVELGDQSGSSVFGRSQITKSWHPKLRILVGANWWCQWWEAIPEDSG